MQAINAFVSSLNSILFHDYVVYVLLFTGIAFTIWSGFGQWRALTHGTAVVRGKYDERHDPGAISHFQALSTALSATVGLGNIAGVAVAVALGGPGAIFWMWITGFLGMALKLTEVTQSMLYRNTSDPENPHGGPMFVAKYGFAKWGLAPLGTAIGGVFVVTLIISAVTGGNMFQAWNVADTTVNYFGVPRLVTGSILAILVASVIIGGIKVIGRVASVIVPVMCVLYLMAGLWVLGSNIGIIPEMLALIVRSGLPTWLGGASANPEGAFLGGTFGYAMIWGVKRALFSSESGQGSAPIAHSAARTDEPVREGVVAGIEPFIDTIIVCTITALVILASGAYNRPAEGSFVSADQVQIVAATNEAGAPQPDLWTLQTPALPAKNDEARRIQGKNAQDSDWKPRETVFMLVDGARNPDTGRDLRRITGTVKADGQTLAIEWDTLEGDETPVFVLDAQGEPDLGVYGDYAGSSLTAHAFDRVTPGLGKYLITVVIWMFALSTIISWSYYGEQGMVYLFGDRKPAILGYKLVYCGLVIVTCIPGLITTDIELDMWTSLGLGVMLIVNIPLMWIFGPQAMRAYHDYFRRLKDGPMHDEIGRQDQSNDPGPGPSGISDDRL